MSIGRSKIELLRVVRIRFEGNYGAASRSHLFPGLRRGHRRSRESHCHSEEPLSLHRVSFSQSVEPLTSFESREARRNLRLFDRTDLVLVTVWRSTSTRLVYPPCLSEPSNTYGNFFPIPGF